MDLSRIKNKLSNLQSTNGHKSHLWKPSPGKQQIRIVPSKFDKDFPFIELYFHYGINGKSYFLLDVESGEPRVNLDNYQAAARERESEKKAAE